MSEQQKWYYRLTDTESGECVFASANLPIKAEKFCGFIGLEGYTAEEISKEEYEQESDDSDE